MKSLSSIVVLQDLITLSLIKDTCDERKKKKTQSILNFIDSAFKIKVLIFRLSLYFL